MGKFIASLALALLTACGAGNTGFALTESGQPRAWPDGSRIKLRVSSRFSAQQRKLIERALAVYNDTLARTSFELTTASAPDRDSGEEARDDGINGVYWVDDESQLKGFHLDEGAYAITQTLFVEKSGEIQEVDIFFSAWAFDEFSARTDSRRATALFFGTTVHELGHALGLQHSSSDSSIMYPTVNENLVSWFARHPLGAAELNTLSRLYELRRPGGSAVTAPAPARDPTDF